MVLEQPSGLNNCSVELDVQREHHEKSLDNSSQEAEKAKEHQTIENLDIVDSVRVLRNGVTILQSNTFSSSW